MTIDRASALSRAVMALMESSASERLGHGRRMSRTAAAVLDQAMGQVATSEEDREDFLQQANELSDDAIERQWASLEHVARLAGGLHFVHEPDLASWPPELMGRPLNRFSDVPEAEQPRGTGPYWSGVRHRVAHGAMAAALTGYPTSVGFGGFKMTSRHLDEDGWLRVMLAGEALDVASAARQFPGRCDCQILAIKHILRALGIGSLSGEGTLGEQLEAVGRATEFHDAYVFAFEDVLGVLEGGLASGFIDAEAKRLSALGRITIEPEAAVAGLGLTTIVVPTVDEASPSREVETSTAGDGPP